MKIVAFFFFASFTILSEFYLLTPALTFKNFSLLFILYLAFTLKDELVNQTYLTSDEQRNALAGILKFAFIFIFYIFIINLFHGFGIVNSIKTILIQSATVLCLPLFHYFYYKKNFDFKEWIYVFLIINFVFVLFQILGLHITIVDLLPQNPLIGNLGQEVEFTRWFRTTGATTSPIWLAQLMLTILVASFVDFNEKRKLKYLWFFIISFIILLATQARAAIFSFIPLMIMCNFIFKSWDIKKFIYSNVFIAVIIFITLGFQENLKSYFPYTFKNIGIEDTHRFWTNLYISMGVLNESPLFGIPAEQAWNFFEDYADINYAQSFLINPYLPDVPTHHNQLFFFLRYFGLIGVALFLILYFKIFKAIKLTKDKNISFLVGSIFVLDLFFSMTHNNKIFNPILWAYLSLIFLPIKKEK